MYYRWHSVFKQIGKTWTLIGNSWNAVKKRQRNADHSTSLQDDLRRLVCSLPGLLLFAVIASCPTPSFGMDTSPYQVYIVTPAINNYAVLPDAPLPKVCKLGQIIKIMACRGEYEPASFLIKPKHPLQQVRVAISPLVADVGTLPPTAVDVRLVWPYFRDMLDTWPTVIPWLLVHDPKLFAIEDKPQPVALAKDASPRKRAFNRMNVLTREPMDTDTLQPVDIANIQQFWITVHVPDHAKAGTYQAVITVTPENAVPTHLALQVKVPDFELLPPVYEYSIYYPSELVEKLPPVNQRHHRQIAEKQYFVELKNMAAHGCTNPNIHYGGIQVKPDGSYDFSRLEKILQLREQVGMRGKALYFAAEGPIGIRTGKLSDEERACMTDYAQQVTTWTKQRGYPEVYFAAVDEAKGEALRDERESIQAFRTGGGKVFVACSTDFYELVGDILDLPIMMYPASFPKGLRRQLPGREALLHPERFVESLSPRVLLAPDVQKIIKGVHKNGFRIFTYFDLVAGSPFPEVHRRIMRYRDVEKWTGWYDDLVIHPSGKAGSPKDLGISRRANDAA